MPEKISKNFLLSNRPQFHQKFSDFISTYNSNTTSLTPLICLTDFDLTITSKFNYRTKQEFKSSYYFYDEAVINSTENNHYSKAKILTETYSKYESDFTLDMNLRKEKTKEWYCKSLLLYTNPKFTYDSIDKMIQARKEFFEFRGRVKEFFELLMKMKVPIIIVSGGITQFIQGALKTIFPNIDELIKEEKITIVSNNLIFEGENNSCSGFDEKNLIYQFNKAETVSNFVEKKYPDVKNIIVIGDHQNDYNMVSEINISKDNILAFAFVNLNPDIVEDDKHKNEVERNINEYKKTYDFVLVGDCDYYPLIKLMRRVNEKKKEN